MWLERTTPDGRWQYGYGSYNKSLGDLAKTQPVYKQVISTLPEKIAELADLVTDVMFKHIQSINEATRIPTAYIWAKDPNGQKRIGGEWNMFAGGESALQEYFVKTFEPCMKLSQPDIGRQQCIFASLAGPTVVSAQRMAEAARRPENPSLLPLLIVGGVVLYALLRR